MIMGIYSQEEVADMVDLEETGFGLIVDPDSGEVVETDIVPDEPITQEQRQELFKFVKTELGAEGDGILKEVLGEFNLDSTAKITTSTLDGIKKRIIEIARNKNSGSADVADN